MVLKSGVDVCLSISITLRPKGYNSVHRIKIYLKQKNVEAVGFTCQAGVLCSEIPPQIVMLHFPLRPSLEGEDGRMDSSIGEHLLCMWNKSLYFVLFFLFKGFISIPSGVIHSGWLTMEILNKHNIIQ